MKVLVTGARLPAALEIARAFSTEGIEVRTADTVRFGFAVRSKAVSHYTRVPSPVENYRGFYSAVLEAARDVDLVIPVSEEIFYLSRFADQIPLFAPSFETLRQLHSKLGFQAYTSQVPPTRLVTSIDEVEEASREFGEIVLKKEFSRGAIGTSIRPKRFDHVDFPVLAQKFEAGPEVCSYSIVKDGRVLAHVAYEPRYRFGQGASVYFRSVENKQVFDFVKAYVSRLRYTGQIAFDFIETDQGLRALECNPRATSGVHLLGPKQIVDAFLGRTMDTVSAASGVSRSAKLTLLLSNAITFRDFLLARDTAFSLKDPVPFLSQVPSSLELLYRARKWNMKPSEAFGFDLEWNGDEVE